jgi:hypothetical protein
MVKILLKSGAIKEVSEKDAKLLVLVKRGTLIPEEPESTKEKPETEKKPRTYSTKVLRASK